MRRAFSSTARALYQFIWKGTQPNTEYEALVTEGLKRNPELDGADRVEIEFVPFLGTLTPAFYSLSSRGDPHISPKDQVMRVSGKVFRGDVRITSLHAYNNGLLVYSKKKYNDAQR